MQFCCFNELLWTFPSHSTNNKWHNLQINVSLYSYKHFHTCNLWGCLEKAQEGRGTDDKCRRIQHPLQAESVTLLPPKDSSVAFLITAAFRQCQLLLGTWLSWFIVRYPKLWLLWFGCYSINSDKIQIFTFSYFVSSIWNDKKEILNLMI